MISLNYAKKIGDKYILNFYADTDSDLANFDVTKEFMFYGVPSQGSLVTVTTGENQASYYLNGNGEFVQVGGDIDKFIPFEDGHAVSGFYFGDVKSGDSSLEMEAFLSGLTYDESDNSDFLIGTGADGQTYTLRGRKFNASYALYAAVGDGTTTLPLYENGAFKNVSDGKFVVGTSITPSTIVDTIPPTWNGILIGAVPA